MEDVTLTSYQASSSDVTLTVMADRCSLFSVSHRGKFFSCLLTTYSDSAFTRCWKFQQRWMKTTESIVCIKQTVRSAATVLNDAQHATACLTQLTSGSAQGLQKLHLRLLALHTRLLQVWSGQGTTVMALTPGDRRTVSQWIAAKKHGLALLLWTSRHKHNVFENNV